MQESLQQPGQMANWKQRRTNEKRSNKGECPHCESLPHELVSITRNFQEKIGQPCTGIPQLMTGVLMHTT